MITGAGFLFVSDSLKARVIKLLSKPLYKYGLNCASSVIFQNQDDLKEFKENGLIKVEKSYVINGSGVNMKQFVCTALPKQMTFLMISRFIYSKGVLEYFKAAERIKSIYPEVRFIIIGDIDGKADSLSYAEVRYCLENGIVEQVSFTKDVPGYMQQTSVYVLPSYREGTPRSVLEAMACGRPILTTDVPGCRNTVVEGKNGFLVPAKDVDALVDKMSWFITHQEALVPMGRASWELCEERFDVHKVNKAINQIMGI